MLAGANAVVIVLPLPVNEAFTTVTGTLSVPAVTLPVKLAVPPMFCSPSVPVVDTLVPVTSAPATALPVSSVRLKVAPVTAPSVMSPAAVAALVSRVVFEPSVTAPSVIGWSVVLIVPFSVLVPVAPVVVRPPANELVPPEAPIVTPLSLSKVPEPPIVFAAPASETA